MIIGLNLNVKDYILKNWAGRIRTYEYGFQRPVPYRLATAHQSRLSPTGLVVVTAR